MTRKLLQYITQLDINHNIFIFLAIMFLISYEKFPLHHCLSFCPIIVLACYTNIFQTFFSPCSFNLHAISNTIHDLISSFKENTIYLVSGCSIWLNSQIHCTYFRVIFGLIVLVCNPTQHSVSSVKVCGAHSMVVSNHLKEVIYTFET